LTAELDERAGRALKDGRAPEVMKEVGAGRVNPYSAMHRLLGDPEAIRALLSEQ
jgi:hypothetical protein